MTDTQTHSLSAWFWQREPMRWSREQLSTKSTQRRDCCRDRAFPLAIEGSLDREKWQELGRQTEPFSKWTLELQPTEVRYVRAKALKRTVLHLEGFEVR